MYQDAVRIPMGDWSQSRLRNLSETDKRRDNSRVQSGFGKKIDNWIGRELAYPDNVLHFATECSNQGHSATFPIELPEWFIKLFTQPGDVVLDPFMGSGTTAVAAKQLGRQSIGIEIDPAYVQITRERVKTVKVQVHAQATLIDLMERQNSQIEEDEPLSKHGYDTDNMFTA